MARSPILEEVGNVVDLQEGDEVVWSCRTFSYLSSFIVVYLGRK
jgi:hypothetical protein